MFSFLREDKSLWCITLSLTKDDDLKRIIHAKFSGKKFTTGDAYYAVHTKYERKKFGIIRNALVRLTKEGFLKYSIEVCGTPHYNSELKRKGAVYRIP